MEAIHSCPSAILLGSARDVSAGLEERQHALEMALMARSHQRSQTIATRLREVCTSCE
jgi:hypothetical protein